MRLLLATVLFRGVVVIGEDEDEDEAPMLHNDEEVGSGVGPEYDVAVDPVIPLRCADRLDEGRRVDARRLRSPRAARRSGCSASATAFAQRRHGRCQFGWRRLAAVS